MKTAAGSDSRCLRETPRAKRAQERRRLEKLAAATKALVKSKTRSPEFLDKKFMATIIYEQPQPQYEIPRDIAQDTSIGPIERWTFIALLCFEMRSLDGHVVTTVACLANKWCVSRAKMRGYLRNLEDAGWIREIDHEPEPRSRWDVRKYELLRQLANFDMRHQGEMNTGPPGQKKSASRKKRSIKTGEQRHDRRDVNEPERCP